MAEGRSETSVELALKPLAGVIGAEIDVDLRTIDEATFEAVHDVFLEHVVVVFPNQRLSGNDQIAFARRFGELYMFPHAPGLEMHPEILHIRSRAGIGKGRWHSDATFDATPPAISILAARELPERGGETAFANQYAAYDALSPGMKRLAASLKAVHDATSHARPEEDATHPVVRTHPLTGRQALFVNEEFTRRFENMTVEESRGSSRISRITPISPSSATCIAGVRATS